MAPLKKREDKSGQNLPLLKKSSRKYNQVILDRTGAKDVQSKQETPSTTTDK
jgi:hypothetical protein